MNRYRACYCRYFTSNVGHTRHKRRSKGVGKLIVARFFQAHKELRRKMNNRFKELGYDLANKRFVLGKTLGYVPNLTDMTLSEMEQVIGYLKDEDTQAIKFD
jgi:hypothetical protein